MAHPDESASLCLVCRGPLSAGAFYQQHPRLLPTYPLCLHCYDERENRREPVWGNQPCREPAVAVCRLRVCLSCGASFNVIDGGNEEGTECAPCAEVAYGNLFDSYEVEQVTRTMEEKEWPPYIEDDCAYWH